MKYTEKLGLIALAVTALALTGCASLTPSQQATITTTENTLATAATVAATFTGNKKASSDLYALAAVATAYGKAPVPTNIAQATAPLNPGVVGVVLPLITGKANSPKTQSIIDGAAKILATLPQAIPTPDASVP